MTNEPVFLKDIPQEAILYSVDKETRKKKFDKRCFNKKFTVADCEALQQDGQHIGIMYNIKNTDLCVVDIDATDYTIEDLFNDTDIDSCYTDGNTKGFHIWMRMKNKTDEFKKNKFECGKHAKIDFLGEKVFEKLGKTWVFDDACFLNDHHIDKAFKQDTFKIPVRPVSKSATENTDADADAIEKIINLIDAKYADSRTEWVKIILAIKKCGLDFKIANEWSKKSAKHDEKEVMKVWNSYTSVEAITSTLGTIKFYAKKSSPTEYAELLRDGETVVNLHTLHYLEADKSELLELPSNFDDFTPKVKKDEENKITASYKEWRKKTYKLKKDYFEKFNAKINRPSGFVRFERHNTHLITKIDLKHIYKPIMIGGEAFTEMWEYDIDIRVYETFDFLPPPKICESHTLNTFNGLRAERIKTGSGNIDMFFSHIKILCGNDDRGAEYLTNYLAHSVQKAGELPRVALVFQSEQGVGKNVFFDGFVNAVIGNQYYLQTAEMEKIIGRFPMINDKIFVIMDETSGKDSFSNSDKIKNIITAETIAWERKGIDGTEINNCGRYLFFSNNLTPVKIEQSDRRFVVYKCSTEKQNNTAYFRELINMFKDDGCVKSIYDFLKNRDISKWDATNDRPLTKAYYDIKSATIPPMANFLEEKLRKDESVSQTRISAGEIFNEYNYWLSHNGFNKMEITSTKFGMEITKYEGITKKRNGSGVVYEIEFPTLKKFLIKNSWFNVLEECK